VENVSRMPGRRYKNFIGLTYDTPADKVEEALSIIRSILGEHPNVNENFIVRFDDFGAYSLNLIVVYVTNTADYREYLAIKEGINLEIMRRLSGASIEIAFPTQTLYVKESAR